MRPIAASSGPTPLRLGLALTACLFAAALAELTGVAAAFDGWTSVGWFGLRGERHSEHKVVLVASDAHTSAEWGDAPWSPARRSALLDVLKPVARSIVVAEPGRMLPDTTPLLPPPQSPAGVVQIRASRLTPLHVADGAAPPGPEDPEELVPVNFVGGPGRIPTVSARRVVDGTIPISFFDDRVAVLGVTDPARAAQWPTPVGWATPGHVVAHALAGRVDGSPLDPAPWWLRLLAAAVAAFVALLLGGRGRSVRRWTVPLTIMAAALMLDFGLFVEGTLRMGAGGTLAAVGTAMAINLLRRLRELRLALAGIRQATATRRRIEAGEAAQDDGRWNRLAEMLRGATDAAWTGLADFEDDGVSLRWRGTAGLVPGVTEAWPYLRTDAPFAGAFARGQAVEAAQLPGIDEATTLMMLPLLVGGQPRGLWLLGVDVMAKNAEPRTIERLRAMAARMIVADSAAGSEAGRDEMLEAGLAVDALARQYKLLDSVTEQMGLGVLIADPWGRVRLINAALRSRLGEMTGEAADRLIRRGAAEVLAALAGWTETRARAQFADALGERDDVDLGHGLRLQRIDVVDDTGLGATTVFLLTRGGASTGSGGAVTVDQDRVRVDVRPLLLKAGRAASAESRMRIEYEFSDPLPQAECEVGALEKAIESLYDEIRRHSEAGSVTTVSVVDEESTVSVLLMNTSYAVPREALNALFRSEPLEAAGPTERMHIAAQATHRAGGRLDATSDPVSGVVFRLALPTASNG